MKFSLRKASQVAVVLVSAAIVARIVAENYAGFQSQLLGTDLSLLFIGFLILALSKLVDRYTWKMVMSYLGHSLGFFRAMELIAFFQVASYLPGGFWHFIGISYWAESDEIPKKVTAVGTVINEAAGLLVATTLFFGIVPIYLPTEAFISYLPLLLVVPAALVGLHPRLFYPVLNWGLTVIGEEKVEPLLDYPKLLKVFMVKIAAWTVRGVSFYFVMNAVFHLEPVLVPAITALYAGAWAVGLLVFFIPGGLGVREVTGISFLSFMVPETVATMFLILLRVLVFGIEFLLAGLFFLIVENIDAE